MVSPAAKVTTCCSAIPTSNALSGNFFSNKFKPVPDGIAPVIPTIFVSLSACLISVSAKTFVKDGVLDLDFDCSPVEMLNFDTP